MAFYRFDDFEVVIWVIVPFLLREIFQGDWQDEDLIILDWGRGCGPQATEAGRVE